MPRLLVTADLHYNHPASRALAVELIDRMNAAGGDVLMLVGDSAVADGDSVEECLSRFRFPGPKLFVAGNHELWTNGSDSYTLYTDALPHRVRRLGWHWLDSDPFLLGDVAFVGSVGWYDYSFASADLRIPRRFYHAKISPGAAHRLKEWAPLFNHDDIPRSARKVTARWNDGKFVKLHRSDEDFLTERLDALKRQLDAAASAHRIVAGVHHLPFQQLLPPPRSAQWDFARAYLGAASIGDLLLLYPNVSHIFCGHSHHRAQARIRHIQALNIGSGYRWKTFEQVDL